MPSYVYRAIHMSGRISRGQMAASNENELAHYLNESGLELINAREKTTRALHLNFPNRKTPPRVLAAFCTRMHDLLQSGILFPIALHDVAEATENKAMRDGLAQIFRAIANGSGIAASFALYPRLFPPVFIAMIGAGENSGDMSVIFNFLARYTDNNAQTQERLHRALRYPLFLFFVAGGAVAFMMTTVVPQVVLFLNGIQGHLPFTTRLLVALSAAFTDYGLFIAAGIGLCAFSLFTGRMIFPSFAVTLDALMLRLPFIGSVIAKTSLARFAHSFAILFRSGCEVPACLQQAQETVGNHALRANIESAALRVQSGASLSLALEGVMPPFAIGLLRTGERSGNLGKSLGDIAVAYDREAQAATESFIGMLEPFLTLAIGGVLAWTVMAMLGPLYGSLSILGGRM
jgi:type IV pilus assembly protein PilC